MIKEKYRIEWLTGIVLILLVGLFAFIIPTNNVPATVSIVIGLVLAGILLVGAGLRAYAVIKSRE